jgi:hypothetical protein
MSQYALFKAAASASWCYYGLDSNVNCNIIAIIYYKGEKMGNL